MQGGATETRSTYSGDTITFLFRLLRGHGIEPKALLLIQDATMQRRPGAVVRHQEPQVRIVNYAAHRTRVVVRATAGGQPASPDSVLDSLIYADEPNGMRDIDRYLTLLMGEIPRLTDAPGGYGLKGANLIARVDIPENVTAAFDALKHEFPTHIRTANPAFSQAKG